ncbi:MAG: S-layer homology domain-containing protein [Oscillospiraceae bacterium]|nr:S-layer homology domain-containing protein [Oscillospiraceae bacterium]
MTVSPNRPSAGDKVTIQPKLDNGYEIDKITVTDRNDKPVTVTKNQDGIYSFTQPNGTVKVEVSYKPTETTPVETTWNNPFTDVSEGAWCYDAVRYVSANGLMNGYGNGCFGPENNLSRAQFAQILYNKEDRPGVNYLLQFEDVSNDA